MIKRILDWVTIQYMNFFHPDIVEDKRRLFIRHKISRLCRRSYDAWWIDKSDERKLEWEASQAFELRANGFHWYHYSHPELRDGSGEFTELPRH